jgi:hypothetical protein
MTRLCARIRGSTRPRPSLNSVSCPPIKIPPLIPRRRARLTVKLDADKAKPSLDDPALIIDADRLIVSGDTRRDGSSLLNLCIGPNPLRLPALPPSRGGTSRMMREYQVRFGIAWMLLHTAKNERHRPQDVPRRRRLPRPPVAGAKSLSAGASYRSTPRGAPTSAPRLSNGHVAAA